MLAWHVGRPCLGGPCWGALSGSHFSTARDAQFTLMCACGPISTTPPEHINAQIMGRLHAASEPWASGSAA